MSFNHSSDPLKQGVTPSSSRLNDLYALASSSFSSQQRTSQTSLDARSLSLNARSLTGWEQHIVRSTSTAQQYPPSQSSQTSWDGGKPIVPPMHPPPYGRSATSNASAGELRVLNSASASTSWPMHDEKRLRTSTTSGDLRLRMGFEQSDDSTLRHLSQSSDVVRQPNQQSAEWQQHQSLNLLREAERTARIEAKLEEVAKLQKTTCERLEALIDLVKLNQASQSTPQQLALIPNNRATADEGVSPACESPPVLSGPPRGSIFADESDDEQDVAVQVDLALSGAELLLRARKARDARRQRHRQQPLTTDATNKAHPQSRVLGQPSVETTTRPNRTTSVQPPLELQSAATEERPRVFTWNGHSVEPAEGDHAAILLDMVTYLSTTMHKPKQTFKGLTLTLRARGKNSFSKRFTAPSGKFFYKKCRAAIEAFLV